MNEKEYSKMIEAENKRASERLINAYDCNKCGFRLVTKDIDSGTTPMFMKCHECGANSISTMYRVPQDLKPSAEWYRPAFAEYQKLWGGYKQHVEMGGLLFRKIEQVEV